jgi:hypothetical protein
LIENQNSAFFAQVGDTPNPNIESVYAVALYEPKNGTIRHMHHIILTANSLRPDTKLIEKEAVSTAKIFGHPVDNLEVIHIDELDLNSKYRVDIESKKLIKIPSSVSENSKNENANQEK